MPRGRRYPAEMAGMLLAHLGVGVFVAGVLLSESLSVNRDVRMAPGETQHIGSYDFRFDGVHHTTGPNWHADQGMVTENGRATCRERVCNYGMIPSGAGIIKKK